jgi:ParB family chromosome partitioning protein
LGLETVPVIERPSTDQEVLEMALIENLQRQDLNAIEEAAGYTRLARDFGLKQEVIAKRVGKSRASVANSMRLLDLQAPIQRHVADGYLTVGHAKAILGIKEPKDQLAVADQILRRHMTVRAAEKFVQDFHKAGDKKVSKKSSRTIDPHTLEIQNRLRDHFATHVTVNHSAKKGKIELEYYGNDDLDRILNLLGLSLD